MSRQLQGNVQGARCDCFAGIAQASACADAASAAGGAALSARSVAAAKVADSAASAAAEELLILLGQLQIGSLGANSSLSAVESLDSVHQADRLEPRTTSPGIPNRSGVSTSPGSRPVAAGHAAPWPEALIASRHTTERGQCLVALSPIPGGTDLFSEAPAACVLSKACRSTHCWCCCEVLPEFDFPCDGCPQVRLVTGLPCVGLHPGSFSC